MTGVDRIATSAPVQPLTGENASTYTAADLTAMKIAEIKSLAADFGYDIKSAKKDDIIAEFLAQQSEGSAS